MGKVKIVEIKKGDKFILFNIDFSISEKKVKVIERKGDKITYLLKMGILPYSMGVRFTSSISDFRKEILKKI